MPRNVQCRCQALSVAALADSSFVGKIAGAGDNQRHVRNEVVSWRRPIEKVRGKWHGLRRLVLENARQFTG